MSSPPIKKSKCFFGFKVTNSPILSERYERKSPESNKRVRVEYNWNTKLYATKMDK